MKKAVKIIGIVLVLVLAAFLTGGWFLFGAQLTAAGSVEKLEEGLYAMEYKGDYGFGDFLAQGGAASTEELAAYLISYLSHGFVTQEPDVPLPDFGCSTMTVTSPEGTTLFGRNYDWTSCNAMVIRTVPRDGYESVSTTCLDFLGFGEDWAPDTDMMSRMMALAAIYIPMDGMNEKGLCVADLMAGDDQVTHQDTGKIDLTTTAALRLLLDRAATVDEAVALLAQYDIHSDIGRAHHFALADATGKSVVVEYVNGEMVVTETPIVTNHYFAEAKAGLGSASSHQRFDNLAIRYQAAEGRMPLSVLRSAMKAVSVSEAGDSTQWTLICDTAGKAVRYYRNRQFEREYLLRLNGNDWLLRP